MQDHIEMPCGCSRHVTRDEEGRPIDIAESFCAEHFHHMWVQVNPKMKMYATKELRDKYPDLAAQMDERNKS